MFAIQQLPRVLAILAYTHVRKHPEDAENIRKTLQQFVDTGHIEGVVAFYPRRILMQDYTGLPALLDLVAMRDVLTEWGSSHVLAPVIPVDCIIDHALTVENYGTKNAYDLNTAHEITLNNERYSFLKWCGEHIDNVRVIPPGKGICHQINVEYLATVITPSCEDEPYPDTVIGTDSHTPMVNGLGVLGWGVGGIEAEAMMLGMPLWMKWPEVVGVRFIGHIHPQIESADIVLHLTRHFREVGVMDCALECFGPGLAHMTVPIRCSIANMTPEYGALATWFPIDEHTLDYLQRTHRDKEHIAHVKKYAQKWQLWRDDEERRYSRIITCDLSLIAPSIAGPFLPEECHPLATLTHVTQQLGIPSPPYDTLDHGSVVIAAITSCTHTSNPHAMITAALLAKAAVAKGLRCPFFVKTSCAPGSQVVDVYIRQLGLMDGLEKLGFYTVGYGCTTCIGNAGPLNPVVAKAIHSKHLKVCAVLSGNRNFSGRIHADVSYSWLASPALVIAYGLCGRIVDLTCVPVGYDAHNTPVMLADIWPETDVVEEYYQKIHTSWYKDVYKNIYQGTAMWDAITIPHTTLYTWPKESHYIRYPLYLKHVTCAPPTIRNIHNGRIIAVWGDNVTTDHISPAGRITIDSDAGKYLTSLGVKDLHTYGARRGNWEVMLRGIYANPHNRNTLLPHDHTIHACVDGQAMSFYDAFIQRRSQNVDYIICAGAHYGMGSSRDWAAKSVALLGVKIILAESFERIHRNNLICMGVLPCQYSIEGGIEHLGLRGDESMTIEGIENMSVGKTLQCTIHYKDGRILSFPLIARIDTPQECVIFNQGGILLSILRKMI